MTRRGLQVQVGRLLFGLTPKRDQSGETDATGAITKGGDAGVQMALHYAANALLTRATKFSTLKRWAMEVAKRRGMRKARVALAHKLATVLHRIWADGTEFDWGKDPAAAAVAYRQGDIRFRPGPSLLGSHEVPTPGRGDGDVFDLWAERWRRREATGDMVIVRYADDLVMGFQHEGDAGSFRCSGREQFRDYAR